MENRIIFGYDVNAEIEVAAGIGGCGAPNDAFHPFVHYARRYLEREQMGHTEVLAMRTSFYEAGCNPTGCTERKLTYRTAYRKMVDEEGELVPEQKGQRGILPAPTLIRKGLSVDKITNLLSDHFNTWDFRQGAYY